MTIGTPMVLSVLTIGTVYHSSKTVKRQSKQQKWPLLYQSSHVYTQSAEYTKPHKCRYIVKPPSHVPGQWPQPVALWAGLTVCVYMDVHASGSLFAAAFCYTLFYLLMMPAARLVCQRPSSHFPYFWTPLANFVFSRPNSVEYGNSKTTTLLPSAKCTRPLFQGRTSWQRRASIQLA